MAQIAIASPDISMAVLEAVRSPLLSISLVWRMTTVTETARTMKKATTSESDTVHGCLSGRRLRVLRVNQSFDGGTGASLRRIDAIRRSVS